MSLIEGLEEASQKIRSEGQQPRMFLSIKDGDAAKIRFLTDGPQFVVGQYHNIQAGRSRDGTRPAYRTVHCVWDEGEDCPHCARVESSESQRARRINAYVWVYQITRASGEVEEVNAPKVLQIGIGRSGYILNMLTTYLRKYGTLCDRDFEWRRTGGTKDDTTYSLIPEDKSLLREEIASAAKKLPALSEVAKGQGNFDSPETKTLDEERGTKVESTSLLTKLRARTVPKPIGEKL